VPAELHSARCNCGRWRVSLTCTRVVLNGSTRRIRAAPRRVASLRGEAKFHRDLPGAAPPIFNSLCKCISCIPDGSGVPLSLSLPLFNFEEPPTPTLREKAGPSKCVPINLSRRTSGICVHLKRAKPLECPTLTARCRLAFGSIVKRANRAF